MVSEPEWDGAGRPRLHHESPVAAARATGLPIWRVQRIYERWQDGTYDSAPVLAEVARCLLDAEAA